MSFVAWIAGCGRLGFDAIGDGGAVDAADVGSSDVGTSDAGACTYPTARVVSEIDTADGEYQPTISRDGRRLCFARTVGDATGLWCSTHDGVGWGAPREQSMLNVRPNVARMPALSDDGDVIYYVSDRSSGAGGDDIWMARWSPMMGAFTGATNVTEVNTSADERGPELSPDQRALYFDRGPVGASRIFVATRARATDAFGTPTMVSGTQAGDSELGIAPDGAHVVLCSTRPADGVGAGHTSLWCGSLAGDAISGLVAMRAPNMDGACSPAFGAVGELAFDVRGFPGGPGGSDVVTSP
jgi:Tol biopolymer transport system component